MKKNKGKSLPANESCHTRAEGGGLEACRRVAGSGVPAKSLVLIPVK